MRSSEIIPRIRNKGASPVEIIYNVVSSRIETGCSKEQMEATIDLFKGEYSEKAVKEALRRKNHYHQGNNLLHYAVLQGNYEHIAPLVNAGVPVNSTNDRGQTPLHLAARRSGHNTETINTLLDLGANKNKLCKNGTMPIRSCWRNRRNGLRVFNEQNARDILLHGMEESKKQEHLKEKNNPLHIAVSSSDTVSLVQIIDGGRKTFDLDELIYESNETGFSPLQLATHQTADNKRFAEKYMMNAVDGIVEIAKKHYPDARVKRSIPPIKAIRRKEKDSYYYPGHAKKAFVKDKKIPETTQEKVDVIKQMIHAGPESPEIRNRLAPLIEESTKQDLTSEVVDYIALAGVGACPPYERRGKDKSLKIMMPPGDSVFKARLDMKYALGVYTNKNTLFVGREINDAPLRSDESKDSKDRSLYGTIVHEGAHALCKAMYGHTLVYPYGNNERKKQTHQLLKDVQSEAEEFSKVARSPEEKYISSKMNNYFGKNSQCYKSDNSKIVELATAIVTVAIKCGYDKTQDILSQHFPKYNEFWHSTFLKDAKEYMRGIKKKRGHDSSDYEMDLVSSSKRLRLTDEDNLLLESGGGWVSRVENTACQQRYC